MPELPRRNRPSRMVVGGLFSLAIGSGCASLLGADFDRPSNDGTGEGGARILDATCGEEPGMCPNCPSARTTCAGRCGQLVDTCGYVVDCGGCPAGQNCGGGGANVCGAGTCSARCDGLACNVSDGCSSVCDCKRPLSCGGGGAPGRCGCTPQCAGKACGASDECGGICASGCLGDGGAKGDGASGEGGGGCTAPAAFTPCALLSPDLPTCNAYCASLGKCCKNACEMTFVDAGLLIGAVAYGVPGLCIGPQFPYFCDNVIPTADAGGPFQCCCS